MNRFVENASKIFETATVARSTGEAVSDLTIIVGADGAIRMISDCDWPLDSLQAHHGAGALYRVSQRGNTVRVEGRTDSQSCVIEALKPKQVVRQLLGGAVAAPRYLLTA